MTCDVAEVGGFNPSLGRSSKARPPTKEMFHNNSYANDDQGDIPGQEIEGSSVSSINYDRCWHLD